MAGQTIEMKRGSPLVAASGRFVGFVDWLAAVAAAAGGIALVTILLLMVSEIVLRSFFGTSLKYNWEVSGYSLAAVFFLPAAYGLKHGSHVRTSAIEMIGGPALVRTMDYVCFVVASITLGFCAYAMGHRALSSFRTGIESWMATGIKLWIPESVITLGLAIFALQCIAELLRSAVLRIHTAVAEEVQIGTSL